MHNTVKITGRLLLYKCMSTLHFKLVENAILHGTGYVSCRKWHQFKFQIERVSFIIQVTPWRNGSASDSRSEGCVFKSRRGQTFLCQMTINGKDF